MATCSSILAWKLPFTGKSGGLQSTEFILFFFLIALEVGCVAKLIIFTN